MESEEYLELFKGVCKAVCDYSRKKNKQEVPFYGIDSPGMWIDSLRYDNIAPIVIDYRNKTKSKHNRTLLRDAAIKVYRSSLDRYVNREDAKVYAKLHQEFFGMKDYKDMEYWQYSDALRMTALYLMFNCGVNTPLTENILGSLGINKGGRRVCINSVLFKSPIYFNN